MGEILRMYIPRAEAARRIEEACGVNGSHWLSDNSRGRHGSKWRVPVHRQKGNQAFYDPDDIAQAIRMKGRRYNRGILVSEPMGELAPVWALEVVTTTDGEPFLKLGFMGKEALSLPDTWRLIEELIETYKDAKAQQAAACAA